MYKCPHTHIHSQSSLIFWHGSNCCSMWPICLIKIREHARARTHTGLHTYPAAPVLSTCSSALPWLDPQQQLPVCPTLSYTNNPLRGKLPQNTQPQLQSTLRRISPQQHQLLGNVTHTHTHTWKRHKSYTHMENSHTFPSCAAGQAQSSSAAQSAAASGRPRAAASRARPPAHAAQQQAAGP